MLKKVSQVCFAIGGYGCVELEGIFPINVQIDTEGRVLKVQLIKKIGFGMDDHIIASVAKARFAPGRDRAGQAIAGWVKIKFKLEIPN